MSFQKYFEITKDFYITIGKYRPIDFVRTETGINARINNDIAKRFILENSERYSSTLALAIKNGKNGLLALNTVSDAYFNGPKILRLKKLDFEALENTNINIEVVDYNQPFSTVIIELPEEYMIKRTVECRERGQLMHGKVFPDQHYPEIVLINYIKSLEMITVIVMLSSFQMFSMFFAERGMTIERMLELGAEECYDNELDTYPEEKDMLVKVTRASLNAALLMDEGIRKIGPQNPDQFERLQRNLITAQRAKDQKKIQTVTQEIKTHPKLYEIKQDIKLYKTEKVDHESIPTGITLKPHWRKGHYRMQQYGSNNSLRKRIRIAPVLVNSHLFAGDKANTEAIYHD